MVLQIASLRVLIRQAFPQPRYGVLQRLTFCFSQGSAPHVLQESAKLPPGDQSEFEFPSPPTIAFGFPGWVLASYRAAQTLHGCKATVIWPFSRPRDQSAGAVAWAPWGVADQHCKVLSDFQRSKCAKHLLCWGK